MESTQALRSTDEGAIASSSAAPRAPGRATAPRLQSLVARARGWLPKGRSLPVADWHRRHRRLVGLLWLHAPALWIFALSRGFSLPHATFEAGVPATIAAVASIGALPLRWRGAATAFGLMTSSAVLVHVSGGYIEGHFHFFVVLILLTLYEDWVPFLLAFGYVVLHHGIVGALSPESVYNHPDAFAHPWKWALIHGVFVSAAGVGGIVSWRMNEISRGQAAEATARARKTEEANELKDHFIATTSHELRTPLTSIGGFATTLIHRWEHVADRDKLQMLTIIEAQAGRLQHLIEDLLLLSTVESGRLRVYRRSVEVHAAVEEALVQLDPDREIAVSVPRRLAANVDRRYFLQVLDNYVANAQKYGAPPISVSARATGDWVELAVADSGEGVPVAFVAELFEPFSRATDETSVPGSGLGLSIVRGLVEAHGGSAWYEPNRPRGAVFKARFPRARTNEARLRAELLAAEPAA